MSTMAGVLQGRQVAKFKVSGADASSAIRALADAGAERVSGNAGHERRAFGPEPKRSFVTKVAMRFNAGEAGSIVHRSLFAENNLHSPGIRPAYLVSGVGRIWTACVSFTLTDKYQ
jgi:hypothetical protein